MIVFVCIFFLALFVLSLYLSKNALYAPAVIVSGLWSVCLLTFILMDHKLNDPDGAFLIGISIWVGTFCFFSLFAQSLKFNTPFRNAMPSKIARDIYFYFSLATLPFLVISVHEIISSGFVQNPYNTLRIENVKGTTAAFFVVFWMISYVLELYNLSAKNRGRVLLMFVLNLFYAVISLGKTNFLTLFAVTIIILLHKKLIKAKVAFLGAALLFLVFIFIQILRSNAGESLDLNSFIAMYFLSGVPAFETVTPHSNVYFGENTFRFFYAVRYELGLSSIKPVNPVLPFINVPILTNTYTVLYPYYKDFGFAGIAVFGSFAGYVYGWMFRKLQLKDYYFTTIYAILSVGLFVQFMNETIFTLFSQNLQYVIIALIPFVISKYHLFEKKTAGA